MNTSAKKIDFTFFRNVAASFAFITACAAYPLVRYGSQEIITACIAAALLSTANAVVGFLAIEYAFDKSFTVFLKAVFGGMGVRMVLSAAALVAMIALFHLHVAALVLSLMLFYAVNLTLEILFLQKKMDLRTESARQLAQRESQE